MTKYSNENTLQIIKKHNVIIQSLIEQTVNSTFQKSKFFNTFNAILKNLRINNYENSKNEVYNLLCKEGHVV